MLLNKRGEEQGEVVNVEGKHIITPMIGAIRNWYGQIGAEKLASGASGKPTIQAVLVVILFLTVKFSAGTVMA